MVGRPGSCEQDGEAAAGALSQASSRSSLASQLISNICPVQKQLDQAGITVLGGPEAVKEIGNLKQAPSPKHEYGTRTLTLEIVRGLDEAVDHIHSFGSGHTEAIITGGQLKRLQYCYSVSLATRAQAVWRSSAKLHGH